MAPDEPSRKPAILSATDDERRRILREYFRTAPSGVAHFPCPAALKPRPVDPCDDRSWQIYAVDGKSGYVVDLDFIDRAAAHENFAIVPKILIGVTTVSALLLLASLFRDPGFIAFFATFMIVGLAAWIFWSSVFYLPLGFRLRGRQRVVFDDDLAEAIVSVEQGLDRRRALVSVGARATGMAMGLAIGALFEPAIQFVERSVGPSPLAEKFGDLAGQATAAAIENAAEGHVNRHGERLASERPSKETNPVRPGDTEKS